MPDIDGEKTKLDPQTIADENRAAADLGPGDDVATRQPAPDATVAPVKEDAPEQRPNKAARNADKRAQINEEFRRRRAEIAETATEEIAETRSRLPAERPARSEEQPKLVEAQPAADQAQQPTKRKLKVNGREVELSDEEVIAHAQRSVAAGDILDQAKRDRATAEGILEALRATQAGKPAAEGPAASEPAKPSKAATKLSDADLADIVDKIQVGDKADALAALQKYGASVAEDAVERVISGLDDKIAEQVNVVTDGRERVRQTNATLESFAGDNPEFRTSKPLQAALATQAAETMRSKMLAIGVREESLEKLQRDNNVSEIDAIAYAYRTLQREHKLPSHADILTESADEMRKAGMLPAKAQPKPSTPPPANSNFDPAARVALKREIAPQPRRAGALPNSEQQQRTREQVQLDAVRQMRAHRRGR